jgi:hypothetical protein
MITDKKICQQIQNDPDYGKDIFIINKSSAPLIKLEKK